MVLVDTIALSAPSAEVSADHVSNTEPSIIPQSDRHVPVGAPTRDRPRPHN